MRESSYKNYAERVPISPLKKVTFYGPVTTTKGEHLSHVGAEATPSKKTLFSSYSSQRGRHVNRSTHASQWRSRSSSNEERPHSKTAVVGSQIKTRLNCNHTRPSSDACIACKKKAGKLRHRTLISDTPRQSHILPSTRNYPRGGTDGRKLYDREDAKEPAVSILDATWKPGQDTYTERPDVNSENKNGSSNAHDLLETESKQLSEEGARKRVQFADRIANNKENTRCDIQKNNSYEDFQNANGQYRQRKDKQTEYWNGQSDLVKDKNDVHRKNSMQSGLGRRDDHSGTSVSGKDSAYNSSSTSDQDFGRLRNNNIVCRLCELARHHCHEHSKLPRYPSIRNHHFQRRHRTRSVPVGSSSSPTKREELCLLCQRYGRRHYYVDGDDDCCHLCETPYSYPHRNVDPGCCSDISRRAKRLLNPPPPLLPRALHRRWSDPLFVSDGEEEDTVLRKSIPYEPKTEVVKDLKKKLEDEYLHREYLRRKKNIHRRWRSWDAEDLEELRNFRMHRCNDPWEYTPPHKCVHRYLQNDRLFLEPTFTDEDGSSLCSECGATQPRDSVRDPYLYHITLGGLKNNDRVVKENVDRHYKDLLSSRSRSKSHRASYQYTKPSKRLPGDTSKHIYAKLNQNISNILPRNSHYHLRPHLADELRYRIDPHTKRHPSKSMALVDHLM